MKLTDAPVLPLRGAGRETIPLILDGIPGHIHQWRDKGIFIPSLKGGSPMVPAGARTNGASGRAAQAIPSVPFTGAAHEHVEPVLTTTVTPGANVQQLGPFDVPAYGYMSNLFVQITAAGGVAGTVTADFPWNLLQNVTLLDVNGAPLFGPLDGYSCLWSNIAGGYAFNQDPRKLPDYVGSGPNPSFAFRIPVQISHYDGLGSIANQNAAAAYKLSMAINNIASVTSAAFTTAPTLTIRVWLEAWSLPTQQDIAGRPQSQMPPAHGTAQYWSARSQNVLAGNNTVQLTRVGNLIRNLVFISRDATGARVDTVFPDPIIMNWDARQLINESQFYRRSVMYERLQNSTRDVGVWHYSFAHSIHNRAGDETPNLWLPTVQSSRLEITGNSAVSGSIQVSTNDIAPAEITPAERYVERSDTGFSPNPDAGAPVATR